MNLSDKLIVFHRKSICLIAVQTMKHLVVEFVYWKINNWRWY